MERFPEFIAQHPLLVLVFAGFAIALIVTEVMRRSQRFRELEPSGLTQLINRSQCKLIDVRNPEKFREGHIVDAINIPAKDVTAENRKIARRKEPALVLYCQTGEISRKICKQLSDAKIEGVHWLRGGINAWRAEHLPVHKR